MTTRPSIVLSIWECTTDLQTNELVRELKGRDEDNVFDALNIWMETDANLGEETLKKERDNLRIPGRCGRR